MVPLMKISCVLVYLNIYIGLETQLELVVDETTGATPIGRYLVIPNVHTTYPNMDTRVGENKDKIEKKIITYLISGRRVLLSQ